MKKRVEKGDVWLSSVCAHVVVLLLDQKIARFVSESRVMNLSPIAIPVKKKCGGWCLPCVRWPRAVLTENSECSSIWPRCAEPGRRK